MIVIAMPDELKLIGDTAEPILITGVGALNVIEALSRIERDTPILNIGWAGSNLIPVGTKCRIGTVTVNHPNAEFKDKVYNLGGDVNCFTSSDFVTWTDIKEPCVFDMELAYILALGFRKVEAIKIVSDNLSKEGYNRCLTEQYMCRK